MRESAEARDIRHAKLRLLQDHYSHFARFLRDAMKVLGFTPTWMQYDIANYLQYGPNNLMVQAQRGEAKSTITAIFAVWRLLHDPTHRVLIVSAGSTQAAEISTLITRLILTWDVLECMRPDKNAGDRTAVDAFDVHYSLKGIDKSPSVACVGINSNLPGKRADLLIADDVESPKNARTATNRELLLSQTLEFSAICTGKPGTPGRIVYLGTPQTSDSIYNSLPGRGYDLRIWPGRYPTVAERGHYGPHLAPSLVARLEEDPSLAYGGGALGDHGQPTDPVLADEEKHQKEWRDRGPSSYQLNYMLNTALMDSQRFPIKLEHCVVLPGSPGKQFPMTIVRGMSASNAKTLQSSGMGFQMMLPHEVVGTTAELQGTHMQIDPAGGGANADETAFAVTGFLNSTVYVLGVGGFPGGYSRDSLDALADIAVKFSPNTLSIEKNFGHGAFAQLFLPILRAKGYEGSVLEPTVHGQKETRVIGILEPVIARGSLVFLESAIEMDDEHTDKYNNTGKRRIYSLFHQLSKITKQRGSLAHDDRIDALAGSVSTWVKQLALDQDKAIEAQRQAEHAKWLADPTGMLAARQNRPFSRQQPSLLNRFTRR